MEIAVHLAVVHMIISRTTVLKTSAVQHAALIAIVQQAIAQ
jgi:hypothetical protein